jgi:heme exporter protein B
MEASPSEGLTSGGKPRVRSPEPGGAAGIGPAGAQEAQPSYVGQLAAVVWKDLVVELRSRQRIVAMAAFTVLVGVLFNYGLEQAVTDSGDDIFPRNVAAALIWMTLVFAAMLGVGRTFQLEAEDGAFQGVLTSPIPKDAIYLAKVLSNFVLVMLIVLLLMAVFGLFFGLAYGGQPLVVAAVLALGALGFVALATLFAAVSSATSMGETLLPVLLFPLLVPMIVFGAGATEELLAGRGFSLVDGNVRMLGAFTLISLLSGALLFRYVVEE